MADSTSLEQHLSASQLWNPELIRKYDLSGPRYTSYPTAAQFSPSIGETQWHEAIAKSNEQRTPLSLYVHIPFCDTVCYYCACNKIITANKKIATPYVAQICKEIALQAEHVDKTRPVNQLHWGGGTPTYISHEEMTAIFQTLDKHFGLHTDDNGEYSIEIHPAGVNPKRIRELRSLGFNRISMGIQDFNPAVQRAVNRFNSQVEVERLIKEIRTEEFHGISMDLIYGLPLQTRTGFKETLKRVIDLNPDRLSIFNYAHMPHLFKTQKQINENELPNAQEKLEILHQSIEQLIEAGYVYIGMDHFAKPEDSLTTAQREGSLHRNFQGYATQAECDLLAFGLTSISSVGDVLIQNHKNLDDYSSQINENSLAFLQGARLSQDDLIRKKVINQLMCQFVLDFQEIERECEIVFNQYFATEILDLQNLAADNLIQLNDNSLEIKPAGRLLVRRICMVFDAYIREQMQENTLRYSRII